ncbi:MAG: S41 family peptidase [bacterium]|nr:S41 family peptidase [bacterium]
MKSKLKKHSPLKYTFLLASILGLLFLGALGGFSYFKHQLKPESAAEIAKDPYIAFLTEVYDNIQENYWDTITDSQLNKLYKLGAEKMLGSQLYIKDDNQAGLITVLEKTLKDLADDAKKTEFTSNLAAIVLANLNPAGHNGLYTEADEKNLANRVENINPETDLYSDLGVDKNASQEKIQETYDAKAEELKKQDTEEAKQQLEKLDYAKEILASPDKKQRYDTNGAEPTVFSRLVQSDVLHIYIKSFSPTTLDEFIKATEKVDKGEELTTMILDLRGNVGGSIDILPYFLGPFIGPDQYAYEFYQQGQRTPFKTVLGWQPSLIRYKKLVILIDGKAQSTAETMAAVLKKYNVGIVMGEKTAGWGTVERVFPLKEQFNPGTKYSMFLVHHITLRDDNQPIQGNGVDPAIFMSDPNWKKQFYNYFRYPELANIIEELWNTKPGE